MALNPLDLRWLITRGKWPLRVKNGYGSTIPPFSVVRVSSTTSSSNDLVYTVTRPDSTGGLYLVTGPMAIGADSKAEGVGTFLAQGGFAAYDTSGTPTLGDEWGPKSGQFTLTKTGSGFKISGSTTTANGTNIVPATRVEKKIRYSAYWSGVSVAVGTNTQVTGGSASDRTGGGEFTFSSDIITVATPVSSCWANFQVAGFISLTQNQIDTIQFKLFYSTGGAYANFGHTLFTQAYHPNVAVAAPGGLTASNYFTMSWQEAFASIGSITSFKVVTTATSTGAIGANSWDITLNLWNG